MALNPDDENTPISIWKVMNAGTHAAIVKVLEKDADIAAVLKAFNATPNEAARDKAIDTMVRFTGNCLGQAALQEADGHGAGSLQFTPKDSTKSIFRALKDGERPIFTVIDADAQARNALHQGHNDVTISLISRMTGRCVGQSLFGAGISLLSAVAIIKSPV